MKFEIRQTARFKRQYRLAMRRGCRAEDFRRVIDVLASGGTLDERYHDHELGGEYADVRECHIRPDWILMYMRDKGKLVLVLLKTGTHADLFGL